MYFYWIEVKKVKGKKSIVVSAYRTRKNKTPDPSCGGDYVLPIPQELYDLMKAVNGDMKMARDFSLHYISVFQPTIGEIR